MSQEAFLNALRNLSDDESTYQSLLDLWQAAITEHNAYKSIVEKQAELICRYQIDSTVVFANQSYLEYMGKPAEEVFGYSFFEYLSPEQVDFAQEHIAKLQKSKTVISHEMLVQHGTMFGRWIQWTDTPILGVNGEVIEIQAVGRDISRRKEMELALQEREAQLNLVLDSVQNLSLAVFNTDLEYTLIRGNFVETLGYHANDLIGRSLVEKFPEASRERMRAYCQRVLEGHVEEVEYQAYNKYVQVRSYPLRTENGIIGGVSLISDVTERKQSERRQFESAIEMQRYNVLEQFIGSAGHEFYTPLAAIQTALHLAQNAPDEERRNRALEKIQKHSLRLTNLVDGMTTMLRLSSSSSGSRMAINFSNVFSNLIESSEALIKQKGILIELDSAKELPRFIGSPQDLQAAFKHLLDNALRHSPENSLVSIRVQPIDKAILIEIHDNGDGIPKEDIDRIFELFYRRDNAHTTPGLGLGLSIAKAIIEKQHEGTISIQSDMRQGTTVSVRLPVYF